MPKLEDLKKEICGRVVYRNATFQVREVEVETRSESTSNQDATFILISNNNQTERYDWWEGETYIEELDINGADSLQLKTFFKDHNPSVDNAIGRVENKRVEDGELLADVVFGSDEHSQTIKQKYDDGILSDVSIGYRINNIVETKSKGEPTHVMVTDFTIVELSAVWKGADAGAVKIKQSESVADEKRFSFDLYEKKEKLRRKV